VRSTKHTLLKVLFSTACFALAAGMSSVSRAGWTQRQPFVGSTGDTIHFYLFSPAHIEPGGKYPLVLWLHGGLKSNGVGGPNMPTDAFYQEAHQRQHPCFVLRPVAIQGKNWVSPRGAGTGSHTQPAAPCPSVTVLMELLDVVLTQHPIDAGSLHVLGASIGGYGTWDVIARYPEKFASAIPICGGGDPDKAARIKDMKIWIFHSADDNIVPVRGSQEMFRALMQARGESPTVEEDDEKTVSMSADGKIRYTQFKHGGHNSWDRAMRSAEVIAWVFARP